MNNFISQLLKFQLDKYNKENNEKLNIKETSKYIEPLIIFVYSVNKLNESFLNEINKFNPGEYPKIKEDIFLGAQLSVKLSIVKKVELKLNQILYNNTHIYSSEICGLGKTEKIKYEIKKSNKRYIYFPLGGKLSRNIIFEKVEKILEKVEDVMNTAIHLDLYETEDISILNEFFFSFCITKFYSNNKNVLYIPINVEIYIEIPNCFNNFLENYPILNYFKIDKIELKHREKLRIDPETTKFFNWMIPEEEKEGKKIKLTPEEYIINNIGAEKFSYHQINIFIKLFINQYKMDNAKLTFRDENKEDVTTECIKQFAESTKYFTLGIYAKYLTKSLDEENDIPLTKDTPKKKEHTSINTNNINEENYQSNTKIDINLENENKSDNINNQNTINSNNNKSVEFKGKESKVNTSQIERDYEEQRKQYINKLSIYYDKDLKEEKYETPLIFIIKNTDFYHKIYLSNEKLNAYNTIKFLEEIKYIFQLENPVVKTKESNLVSLKEIIDKDNYVITPDNFRKMSLISYRILADVPVILMGETGCGKTGLIRKLYQILNNGEDMNPEKNMVNIDSSINDEKLIEKMENINKEARIQKNKDFWVLFDEINTCNSLGMLKEIFIDRSYNGTKLEKNIRLIGTCNPYRIKTKKEESCGLSHPYKNKNLVYDVNILPQSLMYFVFNFGQLDKDDEDKYIHSILTNHFKKRRGGKFINIVKEIISKCHEYLRKLYGYSIVSLREIKRFIKLYDNLIKFYNNKDNLDIENNNVEKEEDNTVKKNKKNKTGKNLGKTGNNGIKIKVNQIKAFIVATYLNYYIRLMDQEKRTNFEAKIVTNLKNLANYYQENEEIQENTQKENEEIKIEDEQQKDEKNDYTNPLGIKWKPLIEDYNKFMSDNNQNFSIFFINECDYLINNIELDKGIAKNRILKENIFLQFIAITSNIPLIIIGKPGSSKSLSSQLLKKSMRGTYSKSKFFRKYPQILSTYFQGSESTLAEDIENLFEIGKEKLSKYEKSENKPISLLIFDEIGLSEFAKDNPVKVLHKNLEYDGIKDGLSFVGFSNWKLDSSKLNRVLYLSVPDLDSRFDDLKDTARCIAESIRENNIDPLLIDLLCKS